MRPLWIGGVAAGIGVALMLRNRSTHQASSHASRNWETVKNFENHWPLSTRVAVGLIGGGLMVYGMRAPGRMGRMATTTGVGLLTRSVNDVPIHDWTEVLKPHLTLGV